MFFKRGYHPGYA